MGTGGGGVLCATRSLVRRWRVLAPRGVALCLPLVLAGSLDLGAAATGVQQVWSPSGPNTSDSRWLNGLVGTPVPVGAMPGGWVRSVPPDTSVVPVGGNPKVLVMRQGDGPAAVLTSTPQPGDTAAPEALTSDGIPVRTLKAYVAAAAIMTNNDPGCHVTWSLLAGIGRIESDHGRYGGSTILASGEVTPDILGPRLDGRNGMALIWDTDHGRWDGDTVYDRAVGPMQFLPGTWTWIGSDANGDGVADPENVDDAALSAARYLCMGGGDLGTQTGRWNAVLRYNHSTSYVETVLATADSYASGRVVAVPAPPAGVQLPTGEPSGTAGPPAGVTPVTKPGAPPAPPVFTPLPTPGPTGTPRGSTPTGSSPVAGGSPPIAPTGTASPTASASPTGLPTTSDPTGTGTPPTPTDTASTPPASTPPPTTTPAPTDTGPIDTATPPPVPTDTTDPTPTDPTTDPTTTAPTTTDPTTTDPTTTDPTTTAPTTTDPTTTDPTTTAPTTTDPTTTDPTTTGPTTTGPTTTAPTTAATTPPTAPS